MKRTIRLVATVVVCVLVALGVTAQTATLPDLDPAAITSTAIVEQATARAAEGDAQDAAAEPGGLSGIEQTATALVEAMFTPLPFDPVPDGPPLPGPDSNTGGDGPDFTPLLVIGGALVVLIVAGVLARMGRSGEADSDEPASD